MSCTWFGRLSFLLRICGSWLQARIVLIVVAERRLEHVFRLAANELPPDTAAIAATVGVGIDQEAGDGVLAECFEEILAGARGSEGPADRCRILVKRAKDFVLLLRSCNR